MNTVYIIEHIIVMGPVIETYTHTTENVNEAQVIFDTYVNDPIEEKYLTRLFGVDSSGLREIRSQGSWE